MRIAICPICKKEWQVRGGMVFQSIGRHIKQEHKVEQIAA